MDLFTPVVPEDKLHHNFKQTLAPGTEGVRAVLNDWADGFVDRDGKFVVEFQTTYNSCFWEIYLFAVLKFVGATVDFRHSAPDFVCASHPLTIEAAIASHSSEDTPEWQKTFEGIVHDDLRGAYVQSIIRLSNAFRGKAAKYVASYSRLPHMAGKAFVIAIANYSTQDFYMLGDVAMQRLLYDGDGEGEVFKPNGSSVPVGIFNTPEFSYVSAVLYSSTATFGKTRALGPCDLPIMFHAVRITSENEPIRVMQPKSEYRESLTDGLRLFVNRHASVPVDLSLFDDPGVRVFLPNGVDDMLVSSHPDGDLCMRSVIHLMVHDE